MKKTFAVIAVMLAAVMAVTFFGCGKKDNENYFEEFPTYVEGGEIETIEIDQNPTAKIEFADGQSISIELDYYSAPNAVDNFIALAKKGIYEGTAFNTAVRNGAFLMLGNADNKPVSLDYYLQDEPSGSATLPRGTVCALPQGVGNNNTMSSYFMVVLKDVSCNLLETYTIIGNVTEGIEALDAMASTENTTDDVSAGKYTVSAPAITKITVDTHGDKFPAPVIIPKES